ncbi:MAG: PorV/PorQ family protein [Candidatus Cloacimonetes bacterium]|nr:PorV/PorQ family protein [Candidatus Cloacimonadota bacterium]
MIKSKLVWILLLMLISSLWGIHDDAGTSGFNFLKMNFSTRAAAMGNAYTGLSNDADGVFFNPAGLVRTTRMELATTYLNYFEGYNGGSLAFVLPVEKNIRLATFIQFLTTSDIEKTLVDAAGNYAGTDGTFGSTDFVVGLSYARVLNDVLYLGSNLKFISETIDDNNAVAIAGDISLMHRTTNDDLMLGASLRNVGKQLTYFTDAEYAEGLPTVAEVGFSYHPLEQLYANLDICKPLTSDIYGKLGVEYKVHRLLSLRGGYKTNAADWKLGGDYDWLSGVSMGFGVCWKSYMIDYAAVSYGDLGLVNQFSIKYLFK